MVDGDSTIGQATTERVLDADSAEWVRTLTATGAEYEAGVDVLTEHQRRLFVAIVLNGIPLDVVVAEYSDEPLRDLQDALRCAA